MASLIELLFFIALARASPLFSRNQNQTFDHGDPNIICTSTKWTDVAVFFLGNYIAHAATVVSLPGESTISTVRAVVFALLFPTSGIARGVSAILTGAVFADTDLETAVRARALCMIVRSKTWRPLDGDVVNCVLIPNEDTRQETANSEGIELQTLSQQAGAVGTIENAPLVIYDTPWGNQESWNYVEQDQTVHGFPRHRLPPDYELAFVPEDARFGAFESKLSCNYSSIKVLVSLGQSLYAIFTLYNTRGDQITQYGYAAFGLTVAPYAVMSLVNLLGNWISPGYPSIYLVRSKIMDEVQNHLRAFQRKKEQSIGQPTHKLISKFVRRYLSRSSEEELDKMEPMTPEELELLFDGAIGSLIVDSTSTFDAQEQYRVGRANFSLAKEIQDQESQQEAENRIVHNPEGSATRQTRDDQTALQPHIAKHDLSSAALNDATDLENYTSANSVSITIEGSPIDHRNLRIIQDAEGTPLLLIPACEPFQRVTARHRNHLELSSRRNMWRLCSKTWLENQGKQQIWFLYLAMLIGSIPLTIYGSLTRFHPGSSTQSQRVWIMIWVVFGIAVGYSVVFIENIVRRGVRENTESRWIRFVATCVYGVPAIGGAVIVAQELLAYGACVSI